MFCLKALVFTYSANIYGAPYYGLDSALDIGV